MEMLQSRDDVVKVCFYHVTKQGPLKGLPNYKYRHKIVVNNTSTAVRQIQLGQNE